MCVGLSAAQPERCAAEVGNVASTSDHDWVAIDFETATGRRASACAVGLVYVSQGRIIGTESFLISRRATRTAASTSQSTASTRR